jgi:hypothetical protein
LCAVEVVQSEYGMANVMWMTILMNNIAGGSVLWWFANTEG